jgi:hypothetical protein
MEEIMTIETERTRNAALKILDRLGIEWRRTGKGQRFVIEFSYKGRAVSALVKTASRGGAIARASSDDPDDATLSGFGQDITDVFFAVANPYSGEVSAYLVPAVTAENAWKEAHRAFRATHRNGKANTTWVIHFNDVGSSSESNGYQRKWARYLLGDADPIGLSGAPHNRLPGLSIEEAKQGLSERFAVPIDSIRITIEH